MNASNTPIAILAGGKSRRMGRDKAFVELDGTPMIQWVITAVKECSVNPLIIANEPDRYGGFGLPVYPDIVPGMGPLSGLHTAFSVTGADRVMIVSCDSPLVTPDVINLILNYQFNGAEAVIPFVDGREQGLMAVYARSGIERFADRIASASIMFDEFRLGLNRIFITEDELRKVDPFLLAFLNVNTPEDIDAAVRSLPK
ncbi:MAG: molybdenum cofactor guanylyltransferase [Nitrospinae bacterium]|nr:molybdenum cofactor guanylyltransferase [Nitrospinota bacterium]